MKGESNMQEEIKRYKRASREYLLNSEYELTDRLLEYILQRIEVNKKEIEELIKNNKEKISYLEIKNAIKEEKEVVVNCKDYKNLYINKSNFLLMRMLMPIGIIAVEVYDTIETIKYFIRAIKSRNAIIISDVEYSEISVKYLIYEIIKQALKKFEIDENLITILPFEECYYNYFDRVIYTYDKKGNKLEKNKYDIIECEEKNYIYVESEEMKEVALNDNTDTRYELITGEFEDVLAEINNRKCNTAVIYTNNSKKAYEFVNLVKSDNAFVNASIKNIMKKEESANELYEYKNIIIPIPHEISKEIYNIQEKQKQRNELEDTEKNKESEETALVEIDKGIFAKIKRILRKFFK